MTTNYRLYNGKIDWKKADQVIVSMSNAGARPIEVEEALMLPSSTVSVRISQLRASGAITAPPAAGGRRPLLKVERIASLPKGEKIDKDEVFGPVVRIVATGVVRAKGHITTHLSAE